LKSQRLMLPLTLEKLGEKMVSCIASVSSTLQDVITAHIMEPIPSCKQHAMLQVQEEKDLDDYWQWSGCFKLTLLLLTCIIALQEMVLGRYF
jgi:hypothetical protein